MAHSETLHCFYRWNLLTWCSLDSWSLTLKFSRSSANQAEKKRVWNSWSEEKKFWRSQHSQWMKRLMADGSLFCQNWVFFFFFVLFCFVLFCFFVIFVNHRCRLWHSISSSNLFWYFKRADLLPLRLSTQREKGKRLPTHFPELQGGHLKCKSQLYFLLSWVATFLWKLPDLNLDVGIQEPRHSPRHVPV